MSSQYYSSISSISRGTVHHIILLFSNIKGYCSVFIISSCYLSISLISRGTVPNIIFLFTNIFDIKGKCSPFSPFINSSRKFCPILAIPFSCHLLLSSFWGRLDDRCSFYLLTLQPLQSVVIFEDCVYKTRV